MPFKGQTVLYRQSNLDEHPAIVTRVVDETRVNLMVMFDGLGPRVRGNVQRMIEFPSNQPDAEGWRYLPDGS